MARRQPTEEKRGTSADLSEIELRFIDEFLIDRDSAAAALRSGVPRISIKRQLEKWMGDPRIARAIQMRTDSFDLDKMITPQRIMAGFIDVAFDRLAPAAARNSALRELAAMKKMYGEDDKGKTNSGVIMVPVAGSLEEWKGMAMAAQARLKDDVKN